MPEEVHQLLGLVVKGLEIAGARAEVRPLTDRDRWICDQIGPLRDKGLLFTGIDVIGDFMTELNVTSPTGIRELGDLGKLPVAKELIDAIQMCVEMQQS
jgi:glutathione synthase